MLVGQGAKQGQHEQRKNVIQCHDDTGSCLTHTEFAGQGHGNGNVVDLPESTDQEKGETNQNGAFGVQLHGETSIFVFRKMLKYIITFLWELSSINREKSKRTM